MGGVFELARADVQEALPSISASLFFYFYLFHLHFCDDCVFFMLLFSFLDFFI